MPRSPASRKSLYEGNRRRNWFVTTAGANNTTSARNGEIISIEISLAIFFRFHEILSYRLRSNTSFGSVECTPRPVCPASAAADPSDRIPRRPGSSAAIRRSLCEVSWKTQWKYLFIYLIFLFIYITRSAFGQHLKVEFKRSKKRK